MAITLKEHQQIRKDVTVLNERLQEHKVRLFLEAMDPKDLKQAEAVMAKLNNMKGKSNALDMVIEKIQGNMAKYGASETIRGAAWDKLKNVVGLKNPLVQAMTFANALETGFSQFDTIIKNTIGGNVAADLAKADDQTIGGYLDQSNDPDVEKKKDLLSKAFIKALRPKGFFAQFGAKLPNFSGEEQAAFVNDLINEIPMGQLKQMATSVRSGEQASGLATDMQDSPIAGGAPGGAEPTAQTKAPSETGRTDRSTPSGESPARPAGPGVSDEFQRDITDYIAKNTRIDANTVGKVVAALAAQGKLKESIERGHLIRLVKNVQARLQDLEEN